MGKRTKNSGEENRTLLKCEACGEFHPEKDTEVVYIRVTIGKNCKLDQSKILNNTSRPAAVEVRPSIVPEVMKVAAPGVFHDLTPDEARQKALERRSIVPPGLRAVLTPPPELSSPV